MAKKKAATPSRGQALAPIEVLPPEVALVRSEGDAIGAWVGNIRQFFQDAQGLEMHAKSTLLRFESLRPPTSGDEDVQLQALIRTATADKKALEAHWAIALVFHKLHSFLTSCRKRGTDSFDQAISIGNRHHNAFADEARRKARAEEDRLRREAEERAMRDREEDLRKLEAAALKAEAASPDLSERENVFVGEYLTTHNAPYAARRAGYKDPDATALRLMNTAKVKQAIEARTTALAHREQAQAVRESPVEVVHQEVRPDVSTSGDRTTRSADIYDVKAYVKAIATREHGVMPEDALLPNQPFANDLARALGENINRIPGVRLKKVTKVI